MDILANSPALATNRWVDTIIIIREEEKSKQNQKRRHLRGLTDMHVRFFNVLMAGAVISQSKKARSWLAGRSAEAAQWVMSQMCYINIFDEIMFCISCLLQTSDQSANNRN